MQLDETHSLTRSTAGLVAREWIDNQFAAPSKPLIRSQMRWLMNELAVLCISKAVELDERADGLRERLDAAYGIISSAWYETAPEYATRWRRDEELSDDQRVKIRRAEHTLWERHNPKRAFNEGYESEHHVKFSKDSFYSTLSDYLSQPYLRHATLDWIFLDISISRELCAFGEQLKQDMLPGRRDSIIGVHAHYFSSNGNLAKMIRANQGEAIKRGAAWLFWALALPVTAIWASFHWHLASTASWILGIYAIFLAGTAAFQVLRLIRWLIRRVTGKVDHRTRVFQLWDQMYEVWQRLEGPIVNPTVVREAMTRSAEQGAGWDNAAWALIDRVITVDRSVWIVGTDSV